MSYLVPGDPAPHFELLDQNKNAIKLSDYLGRQLLLYFYPKAGTPGCTTQTCAINDALTNLGEQGVAALGISPDTPEKQDKFSKKHDVGFPLLSDPDHAIADAYGAWGEKSMYGKKYMGIVRSSFLIGKDGAIRRAWYQVGPADTVRNAIAAIPE